jgi:hypothetical protein
MLLQIVKKQREVFDDRGEDFPDAYINYLSGLSGGASLLLHEHEKYLQECCENFQSRSSPSPEENRKKHKLLVQKANSESQGASFDGKILEKARELYRTKEPTSGRGCYEGSWGEKLVRICRQTGERRHPPEKIKNYILDQWYREKDGNSVIFKKYVNMVKKELLEKKD